MFLSQPQFIGVEIGKSSARFAIVAKTRRGWSISSLKEISGEENVALFCAQFKDALLVSSLQTRDVLIRPCEIPLKKTKDVFAALPFHVEPLLPYPIEKAVVQAQITGQNNQGTFLNIFTVRTDHLSQHLDLLKNYHINPDIVTTRSQALASFSTLLPQSSSPLLLVHEAIDEISLVLAEKGKVLAARSIDNKKDLSTEINKTLLNFSLTHKTKSFEAIYFLSKDEDLKKTLHSLSDKPVLLPVTNLCSLTQEDAIHFSLAIGTALAHEGINFRQNAFMYPHRFRRIKKPLAVYFALSVILASTIALFSKVSLINKKHSIEKSYVGLLKAEGISTPDEIPKLAEDFLISLNKLEKELKAQPDTFPLYPQVPKVKEVLSWLTAIAQNQGKEEAIVMIDSLHYQMLKHPNSTHKKEKYKVRLDMELIARDAHAARTFLEALKNSTSWVDPSEEIQWLPVKGKYKVSFFLKDKTKYS